MKPSVAALACILIQFAIVHSDDAHLEYTVVIDAGSAGSRVHVFDWDPADPTATLKEICVKKVHPALSHFYDKSNELKKYLGGLVHFAEKCVPPDRWRHTKVTLLATAGLRKMNPAGQDWIMMKSRTILAKGLFVVGDVKVLSGEEEALYDWLAIISVHTGEGQNVFAGESSRGVIDMGGESKQIAFEIYYDTADAAPDSELTSIYLKAHCEPRWLIQLPNHHRQIKLFSRSYNGYGLISAMSSIAHIHHERWRNSSLWASCRSKACEVEVVADGLALQDDSAVISGDCNCDSPQKSHYHHPCYAPGVFPPGNSHDLQYDLSGSGNFSSCLDLIREEFDNKIPDNDIMCMKNMRNDPLVGIDGFPKIAEILGLSDDNDNNFVEISPAEIKTKGSVLCQRNWNDLHADFSHYMPYRAQRACFGAVFIYYLLVDIYGISENDLQSFKTLGYDSDISWTMGAAMGQALYASTASYDIPFSLIKLEELIL